MLSNRARWFGSMLSAVVALGMVGAAPATARADTKEIDDVKVTRAVDRALLVDESVAAHNVDVATANRVVTLTGAVDSLRAYNRAEVVTAAVKGVRAVVNRLGVEPAFRPDDELQKDVEQALLRDPAADSYEIEVGVHHGEVTLTGTVQSWQEKRLAGEVASGVRGVTGLDNRILVRFGEARPDYEIQKDVEARLGDDVWVDAGLVTVVVEDGDVSLVGAVGSVDERERARWDSMVTGVRSVSVDDLSVQWWAEDEMQRRPTAERSDEAIEAAIRDAWLYDPRVSAFTPEVSVVGGVATLTGTVGDLKAKRSAEQDARNTFGVLRVTSLIKVRPALERADATVRGDVEQALQADTDLRRYDVDVEVENGKVFLTGRVASDFDSWLAEDIASRVKGVVAIGNRLEVRRTSELKSDWELLADVNSNLWWSPYVDSDEVYVSAKDGVVTLRGTVDSWVERTAAAHNAREAGARRVVNDLDLTSWN